ncbi:hypothetical protein [Streptomyces yangpuensis]|uniref:hypothetical protein n=1 Tax=Streptomyces yangpuensis TaxID=1648182 RepID=UPI003710AEA0
MSPGCDVGEDGGADQVQVFDTLGRETTSFSVGDAIEYLLVDEAGQLWAGYFDENPIGIRLWSAEGRLVWTSDGARIPGLFDCYALNVSGTVAWACPDMDFPLVEIRPDRGRTPYGAAHAVAVHGEQVAFYGGYGEEQGRLAYGELTATSVEPTAVGVLTLPDGTRPGHRRVVSRESRIYVQGEPFAAWHVFDLNG